MFYYTLKKDGTIEQFSEMQEEEKPSFMEEWLQTEDKIIILHNGDLAFEKDIDMQAEAEAIAKIEAERIAQEQAEAEQPTVADLVEALDILSNIVLGGAE